jgi:hypothetical protein
MSGDQRWTAPAPWEEWLDVPRLLYFLAPARFDLVFYTEWHNRDFNWFDIFLR